MYNCPCFLSKLIKVHYLIQLFVWFLLQFSDPKIKLLRFKVYSSLSKNLLLYHFSLLFLIAATSASITKHQNHAFVFVVMLHPAMSHHYKFLATLYYLLNFP